MTQINPPKINPLTPVTMSNVLKSASKLVLLLFALAVIFGLFLDKITADQFIQIGTLVFSYYFMKRAEKPGDDMV